MKKHGHRWNKGLLKRRFVKGYKCRDCGVKFTLTLYKTKLGWGGSGLCRPCANEATKRWQARPSGQIFQCACCCKGYEATNRQVARKAAMPHLATLCGPDCLSTWRRQYPDPVQDPFCLAPVPGGCPLYRAVKKSGSMGPYCSAHDKRRDRKASLSVPIKPRSPVNRRLMELAIAGALRTS